MNDDQTVNPVTGFSDAAKRCSDTIRLHILGGQAGKWAAIRLSDGGSDGVVYDTKQDAIRHQLHEQLCCYVKVPPDDMPPRGAENFLMLNRQLYDAGMRLADPDAPDIHAPQETLDHMRMRGIIR